jgi:NADPH2:quinone reductase
MPKAAVIHEKGGPEVFRYEEVAVGTPGPGEVRLRHIAIGVNYADTYHRGGISHPWPVGEPPGLSRREEGAGSSPAAR